MGLLLPPKLKEVYCCLLLGITLALYIQGNYVTTNYGVLDGEGID